MEVREVQIQTQTHKDYTPPPQFPPQIQERDQLSGLTFTTLFLLQSSSIPPRIGSSIPTLFIASISFYFFAVAFIPLPILSFFFFLQRSLWKYCHASSAFLKQSISLLLCGPQWHTEDTMKLAHTKQSNILHMNDRFFPFINSVSAILGIIWE